MEIDRDIIDEVILVLAHCEDGQIKMAEEDIIMDTTRKEGLEVTGPWDLSGYSYEDEIWLNQELSQDGPPASFGRSERAWSLSDYLSTKRDVTLSGAEARWPTCQRRIHKLHPDHLSDLDNHLMYKAHNGPKFSIISHLLPRSRYNLSCHPGISICVCELCYYRLSSGLELVKLDGKNRALLSRYSTVRKRFKLSIYVCCLVNRPKTGPNLTSDTKKAPPVRQLGQGIIGHVNSLVYNSEINIPQELLFRIEVPFRNDPGLPERIHSSLQRRA
ncbi:hypothetical protein ANN_00947 [Periplaneta americana]|uniref:Uncharacterized protein n=1 Tax=Periplaneta americana TaxID=6978 RepID=A0ABQ8TS75_PERAM|nr:hypothetical protein ANN_00947 [Periplaneta americana]